MSEMRFAQLEPWLPRVSLWILALCISALNKNLNLDLLAPSGALVVIMVYYIPAAAARPLFQIFQILIQKCLKESTNAIDIFEKHRIQGYEISQIHKYKVP